MDNNKVIIDDFHVGNLITSFLKKNNITKAHLARELGMATPNVNRLLKRESMNTTLLLEISEKLKHNFFADISGDTNEGTSYTLVHPNIGIHIDTRLRELKMTQTQLANNLGVTSAEISRLTKKDSFDIQKLLQISRLLNYNFFQAFYHSEDSNLEGWSAIMKRNEELVVENIRIKDSLRELYSKLQKYKEDHGSSIDNWDSKAKEEYTTLKNLLILFADRIEEWLGESDQADSPNKPKKDK